MKSKGEHGGRCCKVDERDTQPRCAVAENCYYALTNYEWICGGHGRAILEEVLVSVIEILYCESEID